MRPTGIVLMCIGFFFALICFIGAIGRSESNKGIENRLRYEFDKDYKTDCDKTVSSMVEGGVFCLLVGFTGLGLTIGGTARINKKRQMAQPTIPVLTLNKRFQSSNKKFALTFLLGGQCYWEQDGLRFNASYLQVAFNEWEVRVQDSDSILKVSIAGEQILVKSKGFNEYFY